MELAEGIGMLNRTPGVLEALLSDLPTSWLHRNDGAGTWSAYDIVGHLLHADGDNWLPRIRTILDYGTAQAFDTFDREAMLRRKREPLTEFLERFRKMRTASLAEVSSMGLTKHDLAQPGRHPQVGEVTLAQLLATWVAHDLTHLGQIAEVLARHYSLDVGPMHVFMPALDRIVEAE